MSTGLITVAVVMATNNITGCVADVFCLGRQCTGSSAVNNNLTCKAIDKTNRHGWVPK